MGAIKRHKVLLDSTGSVTGEWFRLDTRYQDSTEHSLQIFTTGSIRIEGTTKDVRGGMEQDVKASIQPDEISELKTYTEDSVDVLTGPWTYIRAVGTGKVMGFI